MGEQPPEVSGGEVEKKLVVFATRIDPGMREQIEGLRGITGQTVNEVGQEALQGWISNKLEDETVREQAMSGIEEEERRLQERKSAIEKVLEVTASAPNEESDDTTVGRSRGRRGKQAAE